MDVSAAIVSAVLADAPNLTSPLETARASARIACARDFTAPIDSMSA
jgi:hypothetical protein